MFVTTTKIKKKKCWLQSILKTAYQVFTWNSKKKKRKKNNRKKPHDMSQWYQLKDYDVCQQCSQRWPVASWPLILDTLFVSLHIDSPDDELINTWTASQSKDGHRWGETDTAWEEEEEEETHRRLLSLILMSTEKRHLKELSLMSSHLHADTRKTGYIKKKKPSTLPAAHTNIIDI